MHDWSRTQSLLIIGTFRSQLAQRHQVHVCASLHRNKSVAAPPVPARARRGPAWHNKKGLTKQPATHAWGTTRPQDIALINPPTFERVLPDDRSKETFSRAVGTFLHRDKRRSGHAEFIYSALRHMREFGVHEDLEAYKSLLDCFPKGKFIAQNLFQVEGFHYPKQQDCAIDILNQMEIYGVVPDRECYYIVINAFGDRSQVMRKLKRQYYWMGKFMHKNPFRVTRDDLKMKEIDLATFALKRMCPDKRKRVDTIQAAEYAKLTESDAQPPSTSDPADSWVASLLCPDQIAVVHAHPVHDNSRPLFVEGPLKVWLRDRSLDWYQLRAEPIVPMSERRLVESWYIEETDLKFSNPFTEEFASDLIPRPSVHEQEDGNVISLCICEDGGTRRTLAAWIKFLEKNYMERLSDIPVVFRTPKSMLRKELVPNEESQTHAVGTT